MYKFRSRPKKSWIKRNAPTALLMAMSIASVSFGFLLPAASGVDSNVRVFSEGLKIHLDRTSPAFAALEDAWMPDQVKESPPVSLIPASVPSLALSVGSDQTAFLAGKIMRANQRERNLYAQEKAAREAQSRLYAQVAADALKKMSSQLRPMEMGEHAVAPSPPAESPEKVEVVAQSEPSPAEEPTTVTKTISLTDLRMSREELLGSLFLPLAQSAKKSANGLKLLATSPRQPSSEPPTETYSSGRWPKPDRKQKASRYAKSPSDFETGAEADSAVAQTIVRQAIVSGPLEFSGGLALSNTLDRVLVYREYEGETLEAGVVWLREGRYEIFVEETTGQLVGELRTPYGDVMGRGQLDFSRIPIKENQRKVSSVTLRIAPVLQGLTGRVLATKAPLAPPIGLRKSDVTFDDLPFHTETLKDGVFEEADLLEGSIAILRANKSGFVGSLAFAHAGRVNDIEIFPNLEGQPIRRLLDFIPDVSLQHSSVIWGKVTKSGRPVSGARVELMTGESNIRPVYFNASLQPDPRLSSTTENGVYAFYPVSPGSHAVQAFAPGEPSTEPMVFPTEERMVSKVDLEIRANRRAKVKVFDAFETQRPVSTELRAVGRSQGLVVNRTGVSEIAFADNSGLLIFDAFSSSEYARTRITMGRDRKVINVPMIRTRWLESLRSRLSLSKEAETGSIIGFVQGALPYKVAMEERSLRAQSRIIYFDSKGEPIESDHGIPGGGFVIFNVPEGFRTVTIQPSGTSKMLSALALVESEATSVMSQGLR